MLVKFMPDFETSHWLGFNITQTNVDGYRLYKPSNSKYILDIETAENKAVYRKLSTCLKSSAVVLEPLYT